MQDHLYTSRRARISHWGVPAFNGFVKAHFRRALLYAVDEECGIVVLSPVSRGQVLDRVLFRGLRQAAGLAQVGGAVDFDLKVRIGLTMI